MSRKVSNQAYWDQHKAQYPFRASAPIKQPSPPQAEKAGYAIFLAVPIGRKNCFWGFQLREDRDRFVTQYGAKVME